MVALKQGPTYVKDFDYDEFRNYLNNLGDSLLVVNDDEIVKVHVHTEDPGLVMQEGLKYGSLVKVKVDNMRNQHEAQVEKRRAPSQTSWRKKRICHHHAVVAGDGLADIFKAQGVDYIISGGQTMNPSTEDFGQSSWRVECAQHHYLAKQQKISWWLPQLQQKWLSNLQQLLRPRPSLKDWLVFLPLMKANPKKLRTHERSLGDVVSGSVTTAVRDTTIDGLEIHEKW